MSRDKSIAMKVARDIVPGDRIRLGNKWGATLWGKVKTVAHDTGQTSVCIGAIQMLLQPDDIIEVWSRPEREVADVEGS